jgi:phage shock protein A
MFESLRQAFREAVENFHTELNRDALPEATDRLLKAMSTEVVDAHRRLDELRSEIGEVRKEAKREEEMARTCVRREEMARGIGDSETQEVARQFALRHLRRKEVLDQKAEVLEREVRDRAEELEDMMTQLKEARTRREAMSAAAGRTGARERLREADDLFAQLNRMEEKIQDMESRAEAAEAMSELGLDEPSDPSFDGRGSASGSRAGDTGASGANRRGASPPSEAELDARLAELKRRMALE